MNPLKSLIQTFAHTLLVVVVVALASTNVLAQSSGEVQNETIVIQKEKKLELPPANREFEKIPDPQPQAAPTNSKYKPQEIGIVLPQFDTKVKVPTTKTDEPVEIHNHYVKAGFGNYATPYLEAFVHTGKQKNYSAGARAKHLSSANGPYKGVKNSLNELDLQGKYWTSKQWVNASIGAGRERYTWYGVGNREDRKEWDADSSKIVFNKVNAELMTGNMSTGRVSYTTGVKFGYQSGNHDNKESNIDALLKLNYQKESDVALGADVFFGQSSFTDSTTFSRILAGITPKYTFTKDKFKITAGLNYTYSGDTLDGSKGSHLYPLIDVNYTLVPNKLSVEGGLKGGMEKNTWSSFTAQNPYLETHSKRSNLAHTNNKMTLYANLKGNVGSSVNVKIGAAYMLYRNLWYMTNSAADSSKFTVLYDNNNTSVVNLNGELTYDSAPFRTGLKLDYYNYGVSNTLIKNPYHRPSFVGTFFAAYTIYKKIVLKTDIYYISGISAVNLATGKEATLKDIIDVNLKAEYRFSGQFSAFVEVNNLLSQKYERYQYYQSRGLNLLLGVTYRF